MTGEQREPASATTLSSDGSVAPLDGEVPATPLDGDGPATAAAPPAAVSPFAGLSPSPGRVVSVAFDVLTQASGDLRRASFYVGLMVLLLATPLAFLLWRLALEPLALVDPDVGGWYALLAIIGLGGIVLATIESRAVAASLLAARLANRTVDLQAAVQRSRTVFWKLLGALALTNVPLFLVQSFVEDRTEELFGGVSEPSVIGAAIVTAVLFSPLAYVVSGVVLGDVGPWTAVGRSVRVFLARKRTGVVVALFEFGAQLLTAFGLVAGLDLILRGVDAVGLSAGDEVGAAFVAGLIVILIFAAGSLLFTVAAIAIAPQVVAFVGLTHAAPGLARIGGEGHTFRWLTRPLVAVMIVAAVGMFAGLSAAG